MKRSGGRCAGAARYRISAAVLAAAVLLLPGCGSAGNGGKTGPGTSAAASVPEYVLTYAENQTPDYPTTEGGERFAELVRERTRGRIEILVYPDAALGEEVSVAEQLKYGGIDFARMSLSTLTHYSDMANVLLMPYLYENPDHMWRVLDGKAGETVAASFEGTGLVPLSWYDAGARSFYANIPIRSPGDMKGRNIRVQEVPLMEELVRKLGAVPVPISYTDVYSALQTGKADGAENNFSSYETMRHYEVAKYFVVDEHMRAPELQMASAVTMSKLSEEDREIIFACARESAEYERMLWKEHEKRAREKVVSQGCEIIELTPEEKHAFRDAVAPLYEEYCGDYMDLIREIQAEGQAEGQVEGQAAGGRTE